MKMILLNGLVYKKILYRDWFSVQLIVREIQI